MSKLVECVPNFSEGRNREVIDSITAAIAEVPGATLLDVDPGAATNRTVVTFVGEPEAVLEAAFCGIAKASVLIDMREHKGEHARQGATDVCPFVPVSGVSVEDCVVLARRLAERVGNELKIPTYLYEAAATKPERESLADIRVGEYEALAEKLQKPEWKPDYGPAEFNARAGVTVIGVRPFLIAYNINLNTPNAKIAKEIGLTIREKGRAKRDETGKRVRDEQGALVRVPGLPNCRATGWFIEEYGRAQVTMNLTDYTVTPIQTAFDRVEELARDYGARVTGSEIVGLVPKAALTEAGKHYREKQGLSTGVSEAALIEGASLALGLAEVAPFDPQQKVVEYQVAAERPLVRLSVEAFAEELGGESPAPGGGSVAALAGALSARLVSMVAQLTFGKKGYREHDGSMQRLGGEAHDLGAALLAAIDDDTAAFNRVMECFSLPKKSEEEKAAREAAMQQANKAATQVPLSVLELCPRLLQLASEVADHGNENSLSDAGVAGVMARAAAYGAYYNVLINLPGIADESFQEQTRARAEVAVREVEEGAVALQQSMLARLAAD
ncbi:MAG: glutamate formimidoyltransferase [Deltaproteobacteria bacterium]|nr:glutamate formimidoyltransferase [Deltaproteobacteria bacterium]